MDENLWNSKNAKWKALQNAPFYQDMDAQMREGLLTIARWQSYPSGKILYETGDLAERCYIVVEGQVSVQIKSPDKKRKTKVFGANVGSGEDAITMTPFDAAGGGTKTRLRALRIEIVRAEGLCGDSARDVDPYVVGHLGSKNKFQTPVLPDGGGSPVWNHVVPCLQYNADSAIDFEVMEHDKYSRSDVLGTATIAIEAIHPEKGFVGGLGLWRPRKKSEDHAVEPDAGILFVNIRWTDKNPADVTMAGDADAAAKTATSPSSAAPLMKDAGNSDAATPAQADKWAGLRASMKGGTGGLGALVAQAKGTGTLLGALNQARASIRASSKDRALHPHVNDPVFDELLPPFPVLVCDSALKERSHPVAPSAPSVESQVLQALQSIGTAATSGVLGPGKIFGEVALFRDGPRGVTAQCESGTKLLVIDKNEFKELVEEQIQRKRMQKDTFVLEHIPGMASLLPRAREGVHLFFRRRKVPRGHVILRQGVQASKQVLFVVSRGCVELTWQQHVGVNNGASHSNSHSNSSTRGLKLGILAEGQMFGSNAHGVEPFTATAASEPCEVLQVLGRDIQRLPGLIQANIQSQLNSSAKFHLEYARKAFRLGNSQTTTLEADNSKSELKDASSLETTHEIEGVNALDGMVDESLAIKQPLWLLKSPFLSGKKNMVEYDTVSELQNTFPLYKPAVCSQPLEPRSRSGVPQQTLGSNLQRKPDCTPIKTSAGELRRAVDPLAEEFRLAMQRREERALPAASGRTKAEQEIQLDMQVRTVKSAPSTSEKSFGIQRPTSEGFKPHPKGVSLPRYHLLKCSSSPALGSKSISTLSGVGSSQLRDISRRHANSSTRLLTPLLEGLQLGVRQNAR